MTPAARERANVRDHLLTVSAMAWLILLVEAIGMGGSTRHLAWPEQEPWPFATASVAAGWLLMLAAMMTPLLTAPIRHVRARSFARRRSRAIALFVVGYLTIWMAAGAALVSMAGRAIEAAPAVTPWAAAAIAVVWQFTPAKRHCLNRSHAHPALAAFGVPADLSALRFGLAHACGCLGSCWPLMALSLTVPPPFEMVVMVVATLWLAGERIDGPVPPAWRLHYPRVALRVVMTRASRLRDSRIVPVSHIGTAAEADFSSCR